MQAFHVLAYLLGCYLVGLSKGENFFMDSGSVTLSGRLFYDNFTLAGDAVIYVASYNGSTESGTLEIWADNILIDSGAMIVAKGAGYSTTLCSNGSGPDEYPWSGGRGGCSVMDSGGGGAHIGAGGSGTKDCTYGCTFPENYEETCAGVPLGFVCSNYLSCRGYTGQNRDAGLPWAQELESPLGMGSSGGDKGCRDGDGFSYVAGGSGGGKIVLNATSNLQVHGILSADGNRGCSESSDSGGGGAGGSVILLAGAELLVSNTTSVSARGGRGGDALPKDEPECAGTQMDGVCDDCGGGGGGGLIFVSGSSGNYKNYTTVFNVDGGPGGACDFCDQMARGEHGLIHFDLYLNHVCVGVDGVLDENCDDTAIILPSPMVLPSPIVLFPSPMVLPSPIVLLPSPGVLPPSPGPLPPISDESSDEDKPNRKWMFVVIACAVTGLISSVIGAVFIFKKIKKQRDKGNLPQ